MLFLSIPNFDVNCELCWKLSENSFFNPAQLCVNGQTLDSHALMFLYFSSLFLNGPNGWIHEGPIRISQGLWKTLMSFLSASRCFCLDHFESGPDEGQIQQDSKGPLEKKQPSWKSWISAEFDLFCLVLFLFYIDSFTLSCHLFPGTLCLFVFEILPADSILLQWVFPQ